MVPSGKHLWQGEGQIEHVAEANIIFYNSFNNLKYKEFKVKNQALLYLWKIKKK